MNNGGPPFVRFPKELYDLAMRAGLSGTHLAAFLVVVRLTIGDSLRSQATVSIGAVEKATGRNRHHVKRALCELILEGVLVEHQGPEQLGNGGLSARVLSLQPDSTLWGKYAVQPEDVPDFLRHDWGVASEQQGVASEQQGGVAPRAPQQGTYKQHTKEESSLRDSLTAGAKSAPPGGGARASGAPSKSKGKSKAAPGSHSSMTDGADDPGRAYLYADDFDDDAEVPE